MNPIRLPFLTLSMVALLAACGKADPVDNAANAFPPAEVTTTDAGPVAGGPPIAANTSADAAVPGKIPAAIRGKWGLTPGDCIVERGDAKGMLVVDPDRLTFYESRAVPADDVEASDDGISGTFNFTGEGQNWSKYVSLKLQGDGLVRTERNPPTTYTYARCD